MVGERICINFIPDDPCNGCEVEQECPFDCPEKKEYDRCMTRQEAVERMATAVYDTFSGCAHIRPFEQVEEKYKQGYYKRAEAALNALLGDK